MLDEKYEKIIEEMIISSIKKGNNQKNTIQKSLSGLYPSKMNAVLDNLIRKKIIILNKNGKYLLKDPYSDSYQKLESRIPLIDHRYRVFSKSIPSPHPLHYEWRFSLIGVKYLFEYIYKNHSLYQKKILFLGTPTLGTYFLIAKKELDLNVNITIIDINSKLLAQIRKQFNNNCIIKDFDVRNQFSSEMKKQKYDIIVIDPPWYLDYYKLFISRSIELMNDDGWMYLTLFSFLIRPSALLERAELMEFFIKSGLSPCNALSSVIEYEFPQFEKKSFAISKIDVNENWRYGDLVVLKSTGCLHSLVVGDFPFKDYYIWEEIALKNKILKVKIDPILEKHHIYTKPEIIPLNDGLSISPTVSRDYNNRKFIDLWTSDNEIFRLVGNNTILDILKGVESSLCVDEIIKSIAKKYKKDPKEINKDIINIYNKIKEIIS